MQYVETILLALIAVMVLRCVRHVYLKWHRDGFDERMMRRWDKRGRVPTWARKIRPKLHFCCELDYALIDETPEFCSCCKERPQ